jgi:protein-disulfide isomerase
LRIGGIAVAVAVVAVGRAVIRANSGPNPSAAAAVTAQDPVLGKADAPVTIVEHGDFKCPFCTHIGRTFSDLVRCLAKWTNVRVADRNYPQSSYRYVPARVRCA